MNKVDLARKLARKSHRSQGEAADVVDTLIYQILKDLKAHPEKPAGHGKSESAAAPAINPKAKK